MLYAYTFIRIVKVVLSSGNVHRNIFSSCGFANSGFYCLCTNFQTQDPIVFDFKVEVSF